MFRYLQGWTKAWSSILNDDIISQHVQTFMNKTAENLLENSDNENLSWYMKFIMNSIYCKLCINKGCVLM